MIRKRRSIFQSSRFVVIVRALLKPTGCSWCARCCRVRDRGDFSDHDWKYSKYCRECNATKAREYYHSSEKRRAYGLEYNRAHPEYAEKWRKKNKEKSAAYSQKYYMKKKLEGAEN